jgi:ethanolamine utilization protein EutP
MNMPRPLRWKVLLAGSPGAGKSTLCRTLLRHGRTVRKTQSPEFHGDMVVDLPGEYVTIPRFRLAFLATAQDAQVVLFLQAADEDRPLAPPGLLQTPPGILLAGVVTKIDLPGADVQRSERYLEELGVPGPYFRICALEEESLAGLKAWLEKALPRGFADGLGGPV